MRVRPFLASIALLAITLPLIAFVAWPHFVLASLFDRALHMDASWRRTRAAERNAWWGCGLFRLFRFLLRVRCDFRVPEVPPETPRSWIIFFNHQHTVEALLVPYFLAQAGKRDVRYVAKKELARMPAIGHAVRAMGGVFVARGGNIADLREIERCARTAREDLGSVLVFPEGTRWTPRKSERSPYRRVLPPKAGGFSVLRRELPEAPVLSGTIRWERFGTAGKTMFQLADLYGQTVTVTARLIPPSEIGPDPAVWLAAEWERKDRELADRP